MPRSTFLRVRPPVSILSIRARYSPSILFREYTVIECPVSHFPFLVLVFGALYFAVRTNDKLRFPFAWCGGRSLEHQIFTHEGNSGRKESRLLWNKSTITKEILTGKWMHCTNSQCKGTLIARQEWKSISRSILCKFPQWERFNEFNSKILNNYIQKYVPKENLLFDNL